MSVRAPAREHSKRPRLSEFDTTVAELTILVADDHWVSRTGMRHLLGGLKAKVTPREAASFMAIDIRRSRPHPESVTSFLP